MDATYLALCFGDWSHRVRNAVLTRVSVLATAEKKQINIGHREN